VISSAVICGVSGNGFEGESCLSLQGAAEESNRLSGVSWLCAARRAPPAMGDFPFGIAQTVDAECRAIRERNGFEEERLSTGAFQN
jgi:hypothetical protein